MRATTGPDEPALINELIKRHLGTAPHATAVECGTRKLSWRKLDARVRHVATGLRAVGLRPGERFAVLSHNHPACLEAVFAAALTGTTAVIVNWRLTEPQIAEILGTQRARLLFIGAEFGALLERVRPGLDALDTVVIVGAPGDDPHGHDPYELWLELHETGEGMYEAARHRPSLDDPVLHAHPTEEPRHVAHSHRTLHDEVTAVGSPAGEVTVIADPLFLVGSLTEALHGIRHGSRTVLLPG